MSIKSESLAREHRLLRTYQYVSAKLGGDVDDHLDMFDVQHCRKGQAYNISLLAAVCTAAPYSISLQDFNQEYYKFRLDFWILVVKIRDRFAYDVQQFLFIITVRI